MADLIFVLILVGFFALCVVYLRWCDGIIGPDEFGAERDDAASPYVATGTNGTTMIDTCETADVTA